MTDHARLLATRSFVELGARQRARELLDPGSFRELVGPFERLVSPWLPRQGIVPQADDGVVVAKGSINGQPAVIAAIEGAFQGGSLGEVGGAKIAGLLELAAEDNRQGIPTCAVLLLETGGVRLQEANLGLAARGEHRWRAAHGQRVGGWLCCRRHRRHPRSRARVARQPGADAAAQPPPRLVPRTPGAPGR